MNHWVKFFSDLKARANFQIIMVLGMLGTLALVSGCGGNAPGGGDQLTGTVRVDGSSTVFPITEAVAEEFMRAHREARVTVGVSGTGGGFSKFLRGETDINDASRPIGPTELQKAQEGDIQFIELPVAYDGLAVVTNPQNDWVDCLTTEELRQIWEPGSDVQRWSQVRSSFPDRPVRLYGPGTASGTYDYFTEAIVGEGGASRSDFTASEDDNVLVQGLQGDPGSLGFFGLAYYQNNEDRLKLIEVDDQKGGEGCVEPTSETVRTGTYQPLSRPLFIYVREASARDTTVRAFTNFYLDNVGDLAGEVGYVPLAETEYQLIQQRFQQGTTGSMFEGEGARIDVSLEELLRSHGGETDTTHTAPADTAA